jgi:hypothetical protein
MPAERLITLAMLGCAGLVSAETEVLPTLRITAEQRYDDDLINRPINGGQFMAKLSPQVGLDVKDHTTLLHSYYAADVFLRQGSALAGFCNGQSQRACIDHRGSFDLKQALSRIWTLQGEAQVWRVADPTSLLRVGLARQISPVFYGFAEVSGTARLDPRTTLRTGYRFEAAKVYDERNLPIGLTNSPFAELWHRVSRQTDLGLEYRFQYFSFGSATADSNALSAGYRYQLARHTKFTAKAGPIFYRAHGTSARSGFAPRVLLDLTQQASHRLTGSISVGHDLIGAAGLFTAYWAEWAMLTGSYRLGKHTSVFGWGSLYRNGPAPNDKLFPIARSDTARGYGAGGGLEWLIDRKLSVQATFTRYIQVAGTDFGGLERNIGAVRLIYTAL